jgi:hypothetical protein
MALHKKEVFESAIRCFAALKSKKYEKKINSETAPTRQPIALQYFFKMQFPLYVSRLS